MSNALTATEITTATETAFNLGVEAYNAGRKRVPCQDAACMALLGSNRAAVAADYSEHSFGPNVSPVSIAILDAYLNGFDSANEAEMRLLFPEMYINR